MTKPKVKEVVVEVPAGALEAPVVAPPKAKPRPKDCPELHDLARSLREVSKDKAASEKGYLMGDHAEHTFGIEIPFLAFQYVIGRCNVIPTQRWISISGAPKSMKSTLQVLICSWYAAAGGMAYYIDSENKASASMLDALTWWRFLTPEDADTDSQGNFCFYGPSIERLPHPDDLSYENRVLQYGEDFGISDAYLAAKAKAGYPVNRDDPKRTIVLPVSTDPNLLSARGRMNYIGVNSIEDWQDTLSRLVAKAREVIKTYPGLKERGYRVPWYGVVDSLGGSDTEGGISAIEAEGHAQERGYGGATRANMNASFFRALSLRGTCFSGGYVRHKNKVIGDGSFASRFEEKEREGGGDFASFCASVNLRMDKGSQNEKSEHPGAPVPGVPVTIVPLTIENYFSCFGPDKIRLQVDLIWQYVQRPNGETRQIMFFDFYGALGKLLWSDKYGSDSQKEFVATIKRLDEALYFTQGASGFVRCEALITPEDRKTLPKDELGVFSFHEFGKRIETTPWARRAISGYLGITQYPNLQVANIDWTEPEAKAPKKKK